MQGPVASGPNRRPATWVLTTLFVVGCAEFEERTVASIPLPADATVCAAALGAAVPDGRACLYVPELPCALELPATAPCPDGAGCRFAGWAAPRCTRDGEPAADLPRGATLDATLRFVAGEQCPAHEEVYATGSARPCEGSALDPSDAACFGRIDFELAVTDDGALAPRSDRAEATLSALFAEERARAGEPAPCPAGVEPADTGVACVTLTGDGGGAVDVTPIPELSCAGTATTTCPEVELVAGRRLTAVARAADCSTFTGFMGPCTGASDCAFVVPPGAACEAGRLEARFERLPLILEVRVEGQGEVRIEPYALDCADGDCPAVCAPNRPCRLEVRCGELPSLVATAEPGFALSSWGAPRCSVDENTCPLGRFVTSETLTVRFAAGEQTLGVDPRGVCEERVTGPGGLSCGSGAAEPGDCERRVPELTPVRMDLESSRGARVDDWGVDCAELDGCSPGPTRLDFTMPTAPVRLTPVVAYPIDLSVEGPGTVTVEGPSGVEATCADDAPCTDVFARCDGQRTLRAAGKNLGDCTSQILGWEVGGSATCPGRDQCPLPLLTDRVEAGARFGLPVRTEVNGPGGVDVGGTRCVAGACDQASTAPVLPADAEVTLETEGPALCFEGCDTVDFERGRCRLTNDRCRSPSVIIGRRVSATVAGDCRATAPTPTPRSAGNRVCRDERALLANGPAGAAERVYPTGALTLTVSPTAPNVEVVRFRRCDRAGNCVDATVPPPSSNGSFDLDLTGTDDVEARVVCEPVYTVEVAATGSGSVRDAGGGAIQGCTATGGTCTDRVPGSRSVSLVPAAASGARFSGWRALTGSLPCAADANPCVFRPLEDVRLEASFLEASPLTVNRIDVPAGTVGGRVRSVTTGAPTPASEVDCPTTCQVDRYPTQTVTLAASPGTGFRFAGWTGDCAPAGDPTCTVSRLDRARSATARFVAQRTVAATVTGGELRLNGVTCPSSGCTGTFDHGATVTLEAVPPQGTHRVTWSGACAGTSGTTCTLAMTADRTASVVLTRQYLDVALTVTGTVVPGARVRSVPTGVDCQPVNQGTCNHRFDLSDTVTLTPAAVADTRVELGGDCAGSTGSCTLTAAGASTTVSRSASARYVALGYVDVDIAGPPGLRVDSQPAGIAGCATPSGGTCTAAFATGTLVRLVVQGSTTAPSFSGNCTPTGSPATACELTVPSVRGATETVRIRR